MIADRARRGITPALGWAMVCLAVTGCAKKPAAEQTPTDTLATKVQNDLAALKAAATGRWHAPWGELDFRTDGNATFSLFTDCVENRDELAPVRLKDGCPPAESTGKLAVEAYRFLLQEGDTSHIFDAYLDGDGKLHLDVLFTERVTPVNARRHGKIALGVSVFKSVLVGDQCKLMDEMEGDKTIPCRFEPEGTLTLLRYELPEPPPMHFDTPRRSMIHLAREQLLVPPSIHKLVFERAAGP